VSEPTVIEKCNLVIGGKDDYSLRFKIHVYFEEIAIIKKQINFVIFDEIMCVFSIILLTIYYIFFSLYNKYVRVLLTVLLIRQ